MILDVDVTVLMVVLLINMPDYTEIAYNLPDISKALTTVKFIMDTLPDITQLEDLLFQVDAAMGAIESHGALCGMLCAQGSTEAPQWLVHVLGEQTEGNPALKKAAAHLMQLYQYTMEQINDTEVEFDLYLPDDDDPLEERVEALSMWCQGFVYGLAAGGIQKDTELPGDTQELIRDMIEISRIGQQSIDADEEDDESLEEDEVAFMEVMEYVRMGTVLIYEELQPLQSSRTVH